MQNLVIPGADNKVRFTFSGVDLTLATDLNVTFGAESYTLTGDPLIVFVEDAATLALDLNATAEVGRVFVTVKYFDSGTTLGRDITSQSLGNLSQIIVAVGSQLIIEDGSIVTDANSFCTDAEFNAYANLNGVTLPATQPERETLLVFAMKYIEGVEDKFKGSRVSQLQELSFPRLGLCVNGQSVSSSIIHKNVKKAQMELAIQANVSSLFVDGKVQTQNTKREKLGDLEIEYYDGGSTSSATSINTGSADIYLKALMENNGNSKIMRRE